MASAIISLLVALFKAFPALESIIARAVELAQKANVADAINRKTQKDAFVDAAIDKKDDNEND